MSFPTMMNARHTAYVMCRYNVQASHQNLQDAFILNWLKGRKNDLVAARALNGWIDDQPVGPWIELFREGINENVLETGGAETPVDYFVEWLAEWGREVHRKQRGLLLLPTHRAKGLELDHVVVLDGGWNRVGQAEEIDAPRRLYYVAMTRANQTLTLARLPGTNPFLDALRDVPAVLQRDAPVNVRRRHPWSSGGTGGSA